jgi:hypothetical protein
MYNRRTQFSAEAQGFRFRNRFDLLPDVKLPGGLSFDPGDFIVGLCGGMCFVALDYYHSRQPVPQMDNVDHLPPALMRALRERQRESNSLLVLKKIISWVMKPDGEVSRLTAWREFPKLRARLDAGEPAVLLLIHTQGFQNPTLNHQVVATGYTFDPLTREAEIDVYDPNRPGSTERLSVNLASAAAGWNLRRYHDEPLRGFFVQSYRQKPPPDSPTQTASASDT